MNLRMKNIFFLNFLLHFTDGFADSAAAGPAAPAGPADPAGPAETRLINDLIEHYQTHARPVVNPLLPVHVTIAFYLTKILGLDEKNQVLTTFGWLEVHWKDEFLTWNSADYGNISRVILPPQLIWLPDFGLENSAEAIYDNQADKKFRAGIDLDGSVQWVPGGKFVTSCELDITLYPFDSQTCELNFVDWTYDSRFVTLTNSSDVVSLSVYKKHGEWDIVSTTSSSKAQAFPSDPGVSFPTVTFRLFLRRKPRFYMINVVAPCILMSILALLVFYLPPDSGEKVSLGITVLLSFSVFLLLIAENVPKTSDYVPLIGIYLTMVMVMTGISIVISVIVLDLHHHEADAAVPRWLRKLAFGCLARLMCISVPVADLTSGRDESDELTLNGRSEPVAVLGKRAALDEVLVHLRAITGRIRLNARRDRLTHQWKLVAHIFDRLLLVVFFVAIVSLTLGILYIYPNVRLGRHATW